MRHNTRTTGTAARALAAQIQASLKLSTAEIRVLHDASDEEDGPGYVLEHRYKRDNGRLSPWYYLGWFEEFEPAVEGKALCYVNGDTVRVFGEGVRL